MGCLLSCHVALLSLEAVVLLDALTMFVLKSDPQVDTRLKWGSPSALPPQRRRQHSAIRTYIATTRHLHTPHNFATFDSWFSSLKWAYYNLCNEFFSGFPLKAMVCLLLFSFLKEQIPVGPRPGRLRTVVQLSTQTLIHINWYCKLPFRRRMSKNIPRSLF